MPQPFLSIRGCLAVAGPAGAHIACKLRRRIVLCEFRDSIAHPATELIWLSSDRLDFFREIQIGVFAVSLVRRCVVGSGGFFFVNELA